MKMRSFCCIMIAAGLLCVCGTGRTDAGLPSTLQEFAEELEIHAAVLEDHFTIRCPSGLMDQLKKPSAIGKDETVLSDLRCKAGSNGSCMLTIHDDRIEFSEVTYYAGWRILCLYRSGRTGELSDRERQTLEAALDLVSDASGSDLEKERYIYDELCERITYETVNTSAGDHDCAVGALLNGRADCDGYADAMLLCCNLAGIPCRYMHGDSLKPLPNGAGDAAHMWNLVSISGNWLMTDLTWGDQGSFISYLFFNMGKRDAADAYLWDDGTLFTDVVGDADFSLCRMKDQQPVTVRSLDDVYQAARTAALEGRSRLLLFGPEAQPWKTEPDSFAGMIHKAGMNGFSFQESGRFYEAANIVLPEQFCFCDNEEEIESAINDYAVKQIHSFTLYFYPPLADALFADQHARLLAVLSRSRIGGNNPYLYSEESASVSFTDVTYSESIPVCISEEEIVSLLRRELLSKPAEITFVLGNGLSADQIMEKVSATAYSMGVESMGYSTFGNRITLMIQSYFEDFCLAESKEDVTGYLNTVKTDGKTQARIYCTDELYRILTEDNAAVFFALLKQAGFSGYQVYHIDEYGLLYAEGLH